MACSFAFLKHSLSVFKLFKVSTMSAVFSLLGDSNIAGHVNKTSVRANPQLKATQVLQCGHFGILSETLAKVRKETTVVILACLTNFISSAEGPPTVSHRVEPVLQSIRSILLEFCGASEARMMFISPPMYRTNPTWYREGLPEILSLFSQVFSQERPDNLRLLPSFSTPAFEADGVHLTPFSGLEFILHLFDASEVVLSSLDASPDEVMVQSSESTRVLEDRVVALEQDHRRLNRVVEDQIAIDSELADYRSNERFEDCFMIYGLAKISDDLVGKAWQDQAMRDVQEVMKILMGSEMPIVFIKNATTRQKDAETAYRVQVSEVSISRSIRKKFGSFFLGAVDRRPEGLLHVNIKITVTPETRIRISLLKLMAKRYRDTNPGSRVQVISYDPRPTIKITPASNASDRRIKVFTYVEAVKKLACQFSSADLDPILKRVRPELLGRIRATFIILSDDEYRSKFKKFLPKGKSGSSVPAGATSSTSVAVAEAAEAAGAESSQEESEVSTPAQVIPTVSGFSKGRNPKRGASSISGAPSKK